MEKLDELVKILKARIEGNREEIKKLPPVSRTTEFHYVEINTLYDVVFDIDKVFGTSYYSTLYKEIK